MGPTLFLRIGLLFILVFTIGLLGRTRRIGFGLAFLLSIVLTPVGGFLVTVLSGPKPIAAPKKRRKKSSPPGTSTSNSSTNSSSTYESGQLRQPQA